MAAAQRGGRLPLIHRDTLLAPGAQFPQVGDGKAGRSQGCPAMETDRAARLLPKLANGGMVFLFAPNQNWMQNDPWVNANAS